MSALEAEYDEHYYRALMSADTLPDGPQLLAQLFQRPQWHRQAACRGMGTEQFFGGRVATTWPPDQVEPVAKVGQAERLEQVVELRRKGWTLRAVGRELGVSGEQVRGVDALKTSHDAFKIGPTSTTAEPCARSPVIRECLAAGQGEHGTWGGLSEKHRRGSGHEMVTDL